MVKNKPFGVIVAVIVALIILIFGGVLLYKGYLFEGIKCESKGGDWVSNYNRGPAGSDGGYCTCPTDTSKFILRYDEPEDSIYRKCWKEDGLMACHVKERLPNCEGDRCSGPIGCITGF